MDGRKKNKPKSFEAILQKYQKPKLFLDPERKASNQFNAQKPENKLKRAQSYADYGLNLERKFKEYFG